MAVSIICGATFASRELFMRAMRSAALYGVRASRIGASDAPLGTSTIVRSFTPSRIATISSRRTKSKLSVFGVKVAGISDTDGAGAASRAPEAPRPSANNERTPANVRINDMRSSWADQKNGAPWPRSSTLERAASLRGLALRDQPLRAQCGDDGLAAAHALLERFQACKARQVELHDPGPARQREQVRVRHREAVAEQVTAALELLLDQRIAPREVSEPLFAHGGQYVVAEQRRVGLVYLGRQVVEGFLQAHALETAVRRRELRGGREVREVLDDRRAFRQQLAVVELERGHVALGIDLPEIAVADNRLGLGVHLRQREGNARLVRDDVGRERAGARGVVQLHHGSPVECGDNLPFVLTF